MLILRFAPNAFISFNLSIYTERRNRMDQLLYISSDSDESFIFTDLDRSKCEVIGKVESA